METRGNALLAVYFIAYASFLAIIDGKGFWQHTISALAALALMLCVELALQLIEKNRQ